MDASGESAAPDRDRSPLHRVEDAVLAVLLNAGANQGLVGVEVKSAAAEVAKQTAF